MSVWDWFGPARFSIAYPLVTVNSVTQAEITALGDLAQGGDTVAASVIVRDQVPPRVALHFGPKIALTKRQGRALAHELNHVLSQLHGVPDETHAIDGGRL